MPRRKNWRKAAAKRRETKPSKIGCEDSDTSEEFNLLKKRTKVGEIPEEFNLVKKRTKAGEIPEEFNLVKKRTKAGEIPEEFNLVKKRTEATEITEEFNLVKKRTQTESHINQNLSQNHPELQNLKQTIPDKSIWDNTTGKAQAELKTFPENSDRSDYEHNIEIDDLAGSFENEIELSRGQTIFGSFNQGNKRFSEQSAGRQCMCNALVSLCYLRNRQSCTEVDVNNILDEGDYLYRETIAVLMSTNSLHAPILQIEELPDQVELQSVGNFSIERQQYYTGTIDRDDNDIIFLSLNSAMRTVFEEGNSAILVAGGYAMAVMQLNNQFCFFDSHSHGNDGLSCPDGTAMLKTFQTLYDLVQFVRQFLFSLGLNERSLFDMQTIRTQMISTSSLTDNVESLLDAYFDYQQVQRRKTRQNYMKNYMQHKRSQVEFRQKEKVNEQLSKHKARKDDHYRNEEKQKELLSKQKARKVDSFKEKEKNDKEQARKDEHYRNQEKQKELLSKQKARKVDSFKEKEKNDKEQARKDEHYRNQEKQKELLSKQKARKVDSFKEKERNDKEQARKDEHYRNQEKQKELLSKQKARKDDNYRNQEKQKELLSKQKARKVDSFKEKEKIDKEQARKDEHYRNQEKQKELLSKQKARKVDSFKEKEKNDKEQARKDEHYRNKEKQKELLSKQKARKVDSFKEKERIDKEQARKDEHYRNQEKQKELLSKQKARENYDFRKSERNREQMAKKGKRNDDLFRESERLRRQERRRQFNDNTNSTQAKALKRKSSDYIQKEHEQMKRRKYGSDIDACIEKFHKTMSTGPDYICVSCNQTFFKESVVCAEHQRIDQTMKENLIDVRSVNDKMWLCNTCLTHLKRCKVPPMSVANGMKFPERPPELDLHQLEERLIALRIPFMQMRELPRGGQTSIRGNVVNVPTDVSNTVNTLPTNLDESQTIPVQLKRKLSFNRSAFVENVRPRKVIKGLKWLLENSDLYKDSNIVLDETWEDTVTQTEDQNVSAFLETPNDTAATDPLQVDPTDDTDRFSEIDETEIPVGNSDTMLDDQSNLTTVHSVAPGEGQHPLSIFQDQHSESLSFPTIYCGQKLLDNSQRQVPVHYSDVSKWQLRSADRRVSRNVPNLFFKVKKMQMKQVKDKTTLALRRFKIKGKKITAKDMLNSESVQNVVNLDEGYFIFRTLRNSPPYLEKRKKDVFAMIRQLGLPTWFTSFSAADTKWSDLLKSLGKLVENKDYSDEDIQNLSWKETNKLLNSDPVTCARYFDYRVNQFINNFLKSHHNPIGHVLDYFYRVEFQQRGSPHIHMLVWIENAPKYNENSQSEIADFVDKYVECFHVDNDDELSPLLKLQTHKHSKTCRKGGNPVCRFGFPLPPMRKTTILEPLEDSTPEEQKGLKDQFESLNSKLNSLKNPVDRRDTYEEFLQNIAEMSHDDYIKVIRSSLRGPKMFLKRSLSQIRMNAYNRAILRAWKANLDIQYILDPYACAMYIVSYLNKSQRGMSLLMEQAVREARDGNFELKRQVRHIGNKFLNSVEISAQEAAYLVLQLPLTRSSRDVLFINTSPPDERTLLLKSKEQLKKLDPDSTDIESNNLIRRYSCRPKQLERWCLADYASKLNFKYPQNNDKFDTPVDHEEADEEIDQTNEPFDDEHDDEARVCIELNNGTKITSRRTPKVLRYVKFNKNVDYENYCRERLMLFTPWRDEEKDLLGGFQNYEENYIHEHAKVAEKMIEYEQNADVLEEAQRQSNEDFNLDEVAPNTGHNDANDADTGSVPSQDYVFFNPDQNPEHTNYDIGQDIGCAATSQQTEQRFPNVCSDDNYRELMRSLNTKQKQLVTHVLQWIRTRSVPMHIFLSGGAGVGKSVVIRVLYQMLFRELNLTAGENPDQQRILLCAPTGKAAYIIKGNTIHSAFGIPACQKLQCKPISSDQLNTLRTKYMNLAVLIIDEVSMCGNRMLRVIDQRLRQIKGVDKVFGGIHVILVGDLHQLRPVLDGWIFQDLDFNYGPLASNLWKENFKLYELDQIMRQKDDIEFAQLLNRLREGKALLESNPSAEQKEAHQNYVKQFDEQHQKDIDLLKTCCVKSEDDVYRKNDVHLFPTNALVNTHNDRIFSQSTAERGIVEALDDVVGDFSTEVKLAMRQRVAQGDASKTGGLMDKLPLACGMKYEICSNLLVEDGLTNGAPCILMLIERKMMDRTDRPSILWVKFDDPIIGKKQQQQYRKYFHSGIDKTWVPIFDKTVSFPLRLKTRNASALRTQFPLRPSAAKTIHRSQGDTMKSVVVHMGTSNRAISHMHYVALSRVQNMSGLQILELNEKAISTSSDVKVEMKLLREERALTLCFEKLSELNEWFTIGFQNSRSFHLHHADVALDCNLTSLDVLGIAESRLKESDSDSAYELPGYQMYRNDARSNSVCRSHHGLVTFIKEDHVVQRVYHYSSSTLEFTVVKLLSPVPVQVVCLYRPPSGSKTQFLPELESELMKFVNPQSSLVMLGDFNFDMFSLNDANLLTALISNSFYCYQLVKEKTTVHGSMLDHIWVNCDVKTSGTIASTWSDHNTIYTAL